MLLALERCEIFYCKSCCSWQRWASPLQVLREPGPPRGMERSIGAKSWQMESHLTRTSLLQLHGFIVLERRSASQRPVPRTASKSRLQIEVPLGNWFEKVGLLIYPARR